MNRVSLNHTHLGAGVAVVGSPASATGLASAGAAAAASGTGAAEAEKEWRREIDKHKPIYRHSLHLPSQTGHIYFRLHIYTQCTLQPNR